MLSASTEDAIRDMPTGTHAILVYDTSEHKRDVLLAHLKHGAGRAGLVYAYDGEDPGSVRQGMEALGMGPEYLAMRGQLTITPAEDLYIKGGRVDIDQIYRSFSEMAWRYKDRGLEGLRASAEMSPFLKRGFAREMQLYEESMGRKFPFPGKGICAYDLVELENSGYLSRMLPIFMSHAMVIMTGPKGDMVRLPEQVRDAGFENTISLVHPQWRARYDAGPRNGLRFR